jgi:hypothetical protein
MEVPTLPDKEVRLGWTKQGESVAGFVTPGSIRDTMVRNMLADDEYTKVWYRIGAHPVVWLKGEPGTWEVQVGKGSGSYTTKYSFENDEARALLYYASLNTHSGHKKRLLFNGKVVKRYIS